MVNIITWSAPNTPSILRTYLGALTNRFQTNWFKDVHHLLFLRTSESRSYFLEFFVSGPFKNYRSENPITLRDVCFCFANNLTKEFILPSSESIKVHFFKVHIYMF